MSILDNASSRTVYKGYDYYKNGYVVSNVQISDYEYEGYVKGSAKEPYYVMVNKKHPKKSYCDCPMANGKTICKHMVALFFVISPEDLEDYEAWSMNEYYDLYPDYDEDDEYAYEEYYNEYDENEESRYNKTNTKYKRPIFFNNILEKYLENLTEEEAKKILALELNRNSEYALENYMKDVYKSYISNKDSIYSLLDRINNKLREYTKDYAYDYKDYAKHLLSKTEKNKIEAAYIQYKYIKEHTDKIFLEPELATYDDYRWFANLYKNNTEKQNIQKYITILEMFFDTLKHYSIKNTIPKSNILITLHILSEYDMLETAENLFKNAKYPEYVEYVLENAKKLDELYNNFENIVENAQYINYQHIANVYSVFYAMLGKKEIEDKYMYFRFLSTKDIGYLRLLSMGNNLKKYIDKILNTVNDVGVLEKTYFFLEDKEKMFELLCREENERRLIDNIEYLKDEYNEELYNYLKSRFYNILEENKYRETYKKAVMYIHEIYKLNGGDKLVIDMINEIKASEYSKKRALMDELDKVLIFIKC